MWWNVWERVCGGVCGERVCGGVYGERVCGGVYGERVCGGVCGGGLVRGCVVECVRKVRLCGYGM